MAGDIFKDSDFIGLSEEEQIDKLRAQQPSFDKYYQADEEGAVKMLREKMGSGAENQSVVGRVIRQFGSGVGEAFTDVAKFPFDAAEWVASKAGSDWSTSVDDSIEEYQREKFPDPTTSEGKIARSIGYWGAVGLQTYITGGALGYLGRFPVKGAAGLGKAGRFISGGAKVELGAGVAGGAAEGSVDAYMDDNNPAKPWLMIGAGILAGGGAGVAIAARGAAKRARTKTRAAEIGEQPTSPGGDGPTPLPVMYRGVGEGSDTTKGFQWHSETEELAKDYGEFRGGKVEQWVVDVRNPVNINNPNRVQSAKSFFADASKQADVKALDKDAVLSARDDFLDHFGDADIKVSDYWATEGAKKATKHLLTALGFDGIKMSEKGVSTVASLIPGRVRLAADVDVAPSANSVKLDAADQATTDELKEILGQDALGRNMSYLDLDEAQKASAQAAMRGWVNDVMVVLKPQRIDQIADGVAAVMNRTGRTYDPSSGTMTQHLMETVASGDITVKETNQILKGFDTSIEQMSDIQYPFHDTASTAGAILGHLSGASRKVKRDLLEKMSPEQVALLKELDPGIQGMSVWKRLENVRRGLLVTQIATAMRNMGTQVANIGIHAFEDMMEKGVMAVVGKTGARGQAIQHMNPVNATGTILRIGGMLLPGKSKTFQQVQELGEFFNKSDLRKNRRLLDPLTASWSSDIMIGPANDNLGFLEKLTLWANSANRLQEFGIRRAVFTAELDRVLSQRGQSLERLIDEGKLGSLNNDDVKAAVAKALETTWGEEFLSNMDGVRGMAGSMIESINKIGIGPLRMTQVIPFPRFMANSVKWQYQHSPLPMVKLLFSPDEWKRVAAGDIKPIIKSTTGTAMFMSAYQLRNSEYAGERWYEVRPSDDVNRFLKEPPGTTYDVRAYNPFASFLFAAELVRRAADGSVPAMSTRDIAMGFMSTNLRAGAGMYVLDQFLDSMGEAAAGIANPEGSFLQAIASEGVQVGGEYLGAAWSGMLVPFQQLKDIARSFQEGGFLSEATGMTMAGDDSMVRDTSEAPFAGQMARKLPGADQNLPGVELPTREAPPSTAGPLKRQFLGITARGPKNVVEKELDRLGFGRSNILPSRGNDKWNTLRAKHMGPLVEKYLPDLVNSEHYQQASDEQKFVYLEEGIARARRFATQMATAENPELAQKVRLGSRKKSLRRRDAKRQRDLVARRAEMEVLRTARTN